MLRAWQPLVLGLVAAACQPPPPQPEPPPPEAIEAARKIVSRLDYIAADYPPTVEDGEVVDAAEYAEQLKAIAQIREQLAVLSGVDPERATADKAGVDVVESRIREKAPGQQVAALALEVSGEVLARRDLILAPVVVPDRERARALFRENCVKCHGPTGAGDGPQRDELAIKPRNLTAPEVAETLSLRRVFNALTDGLVEAEMPSFELLSVDDRWSLAAYVLTLRFVGPDGGEAGSAPADLPGRVALANQTNAELAASLGAAGLAHARTAQAFTPRRGPLSPIAAAVAMAVVKHREGKRPEASDHLDAAIAEVLAPLRPGLLAREPAIAWQLETELCALRAAMADGAGREIEQRAHAVLERIEPAEAELAGLAPIALAGVAGLAGLGWIVVVILAGAAAARASGFRRVGRAVHLGWAVAAMAGTATLLISGPEVELASASQRHLLVAVLRVLAAIAAGVTALALARRLAVPVQRPADTGSTPWWLAMLVFAIGYGGVLDVAAHLGRIAAATGASELGLLVAAAVVVGAVAALLRVVAEARRRIGEAPLFGVAAAGALIAAIALVGQAGRSLLDAGIIEPAVEVGRRFDPLALYPSALTSGAQLATAALIAGGLVFLLISRRAGAAS